MPPGTEVAAALVAEPFVEAILPVSALQPLGELALWLHLLLLWGSPGSQSPKLSSALKSVSHFVFFFKTCMSPMNTVFCL